MTPDYFSLLALKLFVTCCVFAFLCSLRQGGCLGVTCGIGAHLKGLLGNWKSLTRAALVALGVTLGANGLHFGSSLGHIGAMLGSLGSILGSEDCKTHAERYFANLAETLNNTICSLFFLMCLRAGG
jgi:hypothetical protein